MAHHLQVKKQKMTDDNNNETATTTKSKRTKSDKIWLMLVLFSFLVFCYMMLMTVRLSAASSNDHRNYHLEEFLIDSSSSSNTKTKLGESSLPQAVSVSTSIMATTTSNNPETAYVDPYFLTNVPPSDGTNLWDNDPKLPAWMVAYFNWHKHKRTTWNLSNYTQERWVIMQCLADQDKRRCGGTADRLKPLPFMLRMAYKSRRILLIRWTRPAMLEEFLVPPKGGFDWRVPNEMAIIMSNETNGKRLVPSKIIEDYTSGDMPLIRTRYQSFNGGSDWYNNQTTTLDHQKDQLRFDDVFYKVWRIFFRPSEPVAQKIVNELTRMQLVPGHYAAAHLRALYAITERDDTQIDQWAANAVNCASQLRPGMPIFFASDSGKAATSAKLYGANHAGRVETHTPNPNPPLHLDRCTDWARRPTSDFYDTFVDLYLIALGGCVTFNKGGYGHWGLLIGGDPQCFVDQATHQDGHIRNKCQWHPGEGEVKEPPKLKLPLFLEAME